MEKNEFIEALKELVENENVLSVGRDVKELQTKFEDYLLEAERQIQIAQLKAEEKGETVDEGDWINPLKEEFYSLYAPYKEKRKALSDAIRREQEDNLQRKRLLIAQFKEVITKEENIGTAFSAHKQINEKWTQIGNVPRDYRHDIQHEYSRLLEDFFYNMRIYKEIKEYDLEKNYEAKKAIIEKLVALDSTKKVRDIEAGIKTLQDEWEDIGPTKQELWEEIKNEYWAIVNTLYGRIRAFYDDRREKMKENLAKKKEIIQQMEEVLANDREAIKEWRKDTDSVLAFQKEWKGLGFGPRKENEEVWKEFRGLCDQFFDAKSEFFKDKQGDFDKVAEVKKKLIEKAEEVKNSTDWGTATKEIIRLQRDWKKAGNAGRNNEQKLWKQFRGVCDEFFKLKDEHYAELDKSYADNLEKKKAIINEIKALTLSEDKKEAITQLKGLSEQFAGVGFVPRDHKDSIYKAYKEALNEHYDSLDMKGVEKEKVMFQARISTIKGSSDSADLFRKEKDNIRKEMQAVKQEILQFENNLGFFANSKGKNPFKEQVEKNILAEKEKLDALKAKLKLIPNE